MYLHTLTTLPEDPAFNQPDSCCWVGSSFEILSGLGTPSTAGRPDGYSDNHRILRNNQELGQGETTGFIFNNGPLLPLEEEVFHLMHRNQQRGSFKVKSRATDVSWMSWGQGWDQSGGNCLDLLFRSHEHILTSESCNTLHLILLCEMQVLSSLGLKGLPESKESVCDAGDLLSLGQEDPMEKGIFRNPLQYSCLENSMDRGACGLQSKGSQKFRHDWATNTATTKFFQWHLMDHIFVQGEVFFPWEPLPSDLSILSVYYIPC